MRSRSVSRDTLLRSTSFLLRNPLSCRVSSSSAGHGVPSSSSYENSLFHSAHHLQHPRPCMRRHLAWWAPPSVAQLTQHTCPAQPCPFYPAPTYQHHQVGLLPPRVRGRRRRNREIAGREKQEGAGEQLCLLSSEHFPKGDINRCALRGSWYYSCWSLNSSTEQSKKGSTSNSSLLDCLP